MPAHPSQPMRFTLNVNSPPVDAAAAAAAAATAPASIEGGSEKGAWVAGSVIFKAKGESDTPTVRAAA